MASFLLFIYFFSLYGSAEYVVLPTVHPLHLVNKMIAVRMQVKRNLQIKKKNILFLPGYNSSNAIHLEGSNSATSSSSHHLPLHQHQHHGGSSHPTLPPSAAAHISIEASGGSGSSSSSNNILPSGAVNLMSDSKVEMWQHQPSGAHHPHPLAGGGGDQICCLVDNGVRCAKQAGNASYSKRVQKTVTQRKLKLYMDSGVGQLNFIFQ